MLSEGKNIDQVFREKAEAFNAGNAMLEADWAGIRGQLPVKEKRRKPVVLWLRSAAAVAAVAVLFFAVKSIVGKGKETEPAKQPVAKTTTPLITIDTAKPVLKDSVRLPFGYSIPDWSISSLPTFDWESHNWDASLDSLLKEMRERQNALNNTASGYAIQAAFHEQVAVAPQSFTINNNRDNTVNCTKGTSIYIPANTFYSGGQLINGALTFSVTEYYTLGEMAAAKLNTTSGGRILKSGGMLFIKAVYNNQEVDADLKKSLTVNMPSAKEFDQQMQLFLPQKNTSLPGPDYTSNDTTSRSFSSSNTFEWEPAGQLQTIPGNPVRPRMNDLSGTTPLPRILVPTVDVIKPYKIIEKNSTAVFLTDYLEQKEKQALIAKLAEKNPGFNIKLRSAFVGTKRFITQQDEQFPQFITSVNDSTWMSFDYGYKNGYATLKDSLRYTNWLLQNMRRDTMLQANMKKQRQYEQAMNNLSDKYKFSITNLGWINCDRFYDDSREKTDFLVNIGGNARDYIVQVIFPRINSIATSASIHKKTGVIGFLNFPLGEPVYVIAIGARNGKVVAAYKETTITKEPVTGLVFEETDATAFKQKLSQIN